MQFRRKIIWDEYENLLNKKKVNNLNKYFLWLYVYSLYSYKFDTIHYENEIFFSDSGEVWNRKEWYYYVSEIDKS